MIADTYINAEYVQICEEEANLHGISAELLEALIETESSGKAEVVGGECIGLCQLNKNYFEGDLYDPKTNIILAAEYIADLKAKNGDMAAVLMAYNGEGNAKDKALHHKISRYAQKILKRMSELEYIHGRSEDSNNGSSADLCGGYQLSDWGESGIQEYVENASFSIQGRCKNRNDMWDIGMYRKGENLLQGFKFGVYRGIG